MTTQVIKQDEVGRIATTAARLQGNIEQVIVGKGDIVVLCLVAILSEGHLLIEDVPGTGKTVLAKAMARSLGCTFRRIQGTPDLLPTDITGTYVFNQQSAEFEFRPGPIMSQVLLVDEINRATPRTQSALLEAMQELTVTVRGGLHTITPPFFVLATQNPIELEGTYPLPEAQLDRFLFNVILDYLSDDEELAVVDRYTTQMGIPDVDPCTTPEQIIQFQELVRQVPVSETVSRFAVNLVRATRPEDPLAPEVVRRYVQYGASVRATMFLTLAAKARALMLGRYHVTQDDITALVLPVMRHRVLTNYFAESDKVDVDDILTQLVQSLSAPKRAVQAG